MNQGFALPKEGWTYCPKCDADNMLAFEVGKRFECPMCGLVLQGTLMQGELVALVASPPLEFEVMIRYQMYLGKMAQQRYEKLQVETGNPGVPQRVKLCLKLINIIAWCFGCQCRVLRDKRYKNKEVTQ